MKPGNVLWCEELWRLKLIDFGMAEAFCPTAAAPRALSASAAPVASAKLRWPSALRFKHYVTGPYRPPELWSLKPHDLCHALSPSVDIWSYSCTLYEAVTGRVLISPMKTSPPVSTTKHVVQTWCELWTVIQSKARGQRPQPDRRHHLNLRVLRSGVWQETIMKGLNPDPKLRAFGKAMPS